MVKRLSTVLCALGLAACGAQVRPATPLAAAAPDRSAEVSALRARLEQKDERVRELEAQLALLTAEARDLRATAAAADDAREAALHRTVRIGRHDEPPAEPPVVLSDETVRDEGPRPVLRLVGEPELPAPPPGVDQRLAPAVPVAPLPGEDERLARIRADVARIAALPAAALPPPGSPAAPDGGAEAVTAYRTALGLVEQRRFDAALVALTDFLARWPTHPYADNAVYWRGEVRYAQRQYVEALHEFEDVVHRYPDGNKTPEALLKIGLCHRRMGDMARAHLFFQRVARQFPGSDAARAAAREDAS